MEPVTFTIASAVTALVIEASKETGKAIVKGGTDLVSKLVGLVRDRFKASNSENFLTQVENEPTKANQDLFSALLTAELIKDSDFAEGISSLLKQLKSDSNEVIQRALVDIEVEDSIEVGSITQTSANHSSVTQEVAKNIKGKTIKIGDINQGTS